MNYFSTIKLNYDTIDIFFTRKSIHKALVSHLNFFHGTFLDIGCGQMPYKPIIQPHVEKYIGLDLDNEYSKIKPDLCWDGNIIPLDNETIDCAMATEVFEHVPDLDKLLSEAKRVLKPGGIIFFTVPFLWPLHDVPYDEFRYTPFSLERIFKRNGFDTLEINSLGGWNASLAQMLGLWIKRSNIKYLSRRVLYTLTYPFYLLLIKSDTTNNNFSESCMITGITGIMQKKK